MPAVSSVLFRSCFAVLLTLLVAGESTCRAQGEVVTEENVTYGKGGDVDLQLDIARPKDGDGPFPAILFIHGGGWRGGSRQGYKAAIADSAKHGYVAATVSYRLTQPDPAGKARFPFPAQVHDVKCAVRWLRANAAKYKVDPDRIGATGGSAGGHLSLMLGLTDESAGLEGEGGNKDVSSRVQAVVNVYGPTDMPHIMTNSKGAAPIVESFLNAKAAEDAEVYKKASPITYVDKNDPPVLTLHGAADTLVPPDQAERLDKAMKEAGASHTMIIYEKQGHGFSGESLLKSYAATYEFFDKHLKKESKKEVKPEK